MTGQEVIIRDIPPRTIAFLKCEGHWRQLPQMLIKLDSYITRRSLTPAGPASGIYYNTPGDASEQELQWEVFYPLNIETPVSTGSKGDFGIRRVAETKAASIVHYGSYRKTGPSYERLYNWLKQKGFEVCGPSEEVYISIIGIPVEEQRMEIRLPVRSV
ncbi:MAG: GyrI-like domain-containing protein [Dehalococcoidales bacterium]|nr:GyrI-like domain-containing protein [Dehalococcoidales bacterium]